MNELSLFTGAGGGLLGTHLLGWRPVCAVEIEPYCREVLLRRQRDGVLPLFPIWDDVRTFDGSRWRGLVDVVTGGFPCQPFSVAGKGLGHNDPRNMWPSTIRVIREVRPRFCLLENVPGLLAHEYFGKILGDLVESGFRVRWDCLSAASVGAPHRRDRLWIVADAESQRRGEAWGLRRGEPKEWIAGRGEAVADATSVGRQRCWPAREWRNGSADEGAVADADEAGLEGRDSRVVRERPGQRAARPRCTWWDHDPADDPESGLGRVVAGVAHRIHRLKALGNGQVPAVVVRAWEELTR